MMTPLEQAFRARLRQISVAKRINIPNLWHNLVLERFLVRVSCSRFSSNFVLKGGMLLSTYEPINRHTKDLDFLIQRIPNDTDAIFEVLNEIIVVPLDDHFVFSNLEVAPLLHPHMKYTGVRAKMCASFGKGQFSVSVDLGYGDIVEPTQHFIPLMSGPKGALFESSIQFDCYPREFIFAEKLESIVRHNGTTSRVKDFHDLYILVHSNHLSPAHLNTIVPRVFEHRLTPLELPIAIAKADSDAMQKLWLAHLRNLPTKQPMPDQLSELLEAINKWIATKTKLSKNTIEH